MESVLQVFVKGRFLQSIIKSTMRAMDKVIHCVATLEALGQFSNGSHIQQHVQAPNRKIFFLDKLFEEAH